MLQKSACIIVAPREFYRWKDCREITGWWWVDKKYPVRVTRYKCRNQSLARVLFQKHHKISLDNGQRVSHLCKNRACLNIDHIYMGNKKNIPGIKKIRKQKPFLKLSALKYQEIRSDYLEEKMSLRQIATKYGVCSSMVHKIIKSTPTKPTFLDLLMAH